MGGHHAFVVKWVISSSGFKMGGLEKLEKISFYDFIFMVWRFTL